MKVRMRMGRKAVTAGALLVIGAAAAPLTSGMTDAQISGCRTDPLVQLSNGVTVQMSAVISDTAANVASVAYQLHVPRGTSVAGITYSGDVPTQLETFQFFADENPGNYDTYTYVTLHTGSNTVPTVAYSTISGITTPAAQGHTYQQLHVHGHIA